MATFTKAAKTSEIPPNSGKALSVNGKAIAVFNVEGAFYALDNTCLHRGGPLGEGELDGTSVTCPWHGWQYDVTTGKTLETPDQGVEKYEVKVEGEDLLIAL